MEKYLVNCHDPVMDGRFRERIEAGKLTRDENPRDHFCVYFAAYDPKAEELFVGRHKKSGLWLFNGGHIDIGETPEQTMMREIGEEWGIPVDRSVISGPSLFTITRIPSTQTIPCRIHYDLWYFVAVDKERFLPKPELMATEFFENRWLAISASRLLISDLNTRAAVDLISERLF